MDAPSSTSTPTPSPVPATPQGPVFFVSLPPSAQAALVLALTFVLGILVGSYFSRGPTSPLQPARVDINRATVGELQLLPGLGEQLARTIDDDRRKRGPFRSVDELQRVPGIGAKTVQSLQDFVVVHHLEDTSLVETETRTKPSRMLKGSDIREPIDVNEASYEQLQKLYGIGPAKARSIIQERERKPFKTVDDLDRVLGIGPKTIEKLRPFIVVRPTPAVSTAAREQ